ncbi:hypothetical protein QYE76_007212 [Lolium multiflorum]|uniref:Reverse transcriptase Ty1/copia-type domain-containing protein n=1 Tax=Lolium multiflorum TaxID=4521 RepID=A0AAD8W2Y0_LOLMU|nr:hypothetical protein QYE76_007212 [Lolium multiflorum]
MMSPDSNKCQEAMKSEMGSMYDNKVWTLVHLPDSRKAVENKWIFKRKQMLMVILLSIKLDLSQRVSDKFKELTNETFSPVAKLKSVRILLAIAAFLDYEIWQMDVKTAFLNGDIEEELYMVQPKGFVDPKNVTSVDGVSRSVYDDVDIGISVYTCVGIGINKYTCVSIASTNDNNTNTGRATEVVFVHASSLTQECPLSSYPCCDLSESRPPARGHGCAAAGSASGDSGAARGFLLQRRPSSCLAIRAPPRLVSPSSFCVRFFRPAPPSCLSKRHKGVRPPSRVGTSMSQAKRYVLRLFISLKYVTANVVDRQSGRVVVTASSVEKPLRDGLECGRACNAKAAAAVGEVLAMRLRVDGLAGEPIHAAAAKEVQKKGFKNRTKVWAILNALRDHGVNLRVDDDGDHRRHV